MCISTVHVCIIIIIYKYTYIYIYIIYNSNKNEWIRGLTKNSPLKSTQTSALP